jgi:hypothetical protein
MASSSNVNLSKSEKSRSNHYRFGENLHYLTEENLQRLWDVRSKPHKEDNVSDENPKGNLPQYCQMHQRFRRVKRIAQQSALCLDCDWDNLEPRDS